MKILGLFILILLQSAVYAKQNVVVSILPQKTFVQKIAHELVDVTVMVEPGSSPHSYEPKVSQMVALSKVDLYFSIGMDFEKAWLDKFRSQNKELLFVDMGKDVTKIKKTLKEDHHHHSELDPHIWTSPKNVAQMANTIYEQLVKLDPENKNFYKENLETFLDEIKEMDSEIRSILKDMKHSRSFMVFHPAWGYFAHDYNLKQIAFRTEGKNPKPKEMIEIMKKAKKENVKVIFTQPELSDKSARIIAKETGMQVKKISPLNPKWSENLISMAKAIANK